MSVKFWYRDILIAAQVNRRLRMRSREEYFRRRYRDPRLPEDPEHQFAKTWVSFGGWDAFLGLPYETYDEAAAAARRLKIFSRPVYKARYREDPRLPSHPERDYAAHWVEHGEWKGFLDRFYRTIEEASAAARARGFSGMRDYVDWHHLDPKLPSNPDLYYGDEAWQYISRWNGYLGLSKNTQARDD